MQEYESIFVLAPEVSDADVDQEIETIRNLITAGNGEVTEVQKWGRRKLAYEIKKKREGIYTLIRFKGTSEQPKELTRRYRLNESLLRHLTVLYEEPVIPEGGLEEGQEGEDRDRRPEGVRPAAPPPERAEAPAADAPAAADASAAPNPAETVEETPEASEASKE